MFFRSSPCLLGQHGSCSSAQLPVELSQNMLQNLFHNLLPHPVWTWKLLKYMTWRLGISPLAPRPPPICVYRSSLDKLFCRTFKVHARCLGIKSALIFSEAKFPSNYINWSTVLGGRLSKRFRSMFFRSSPCLLGQHVSCSSAPLPVELSQNMLQNLFHNLPPHPVGTWQLLKYIWCTWHGV